MNYRNIVIFKIGKTYLMNMSTVVKATAWYLLSLRFLSHDISGNNVFSRYASSLGLSKILREILFSQLPDIFIYLL